MQTWDSLHFVSALGKMSMEAGVLVLVVLAVQWLFRRQLTPRWRCALWLLVVLRLLLPSSPGSALSVFNWVPHWQMTENLKKHELQKKTLSNPAPMVASKTSGAVRQPTTEEMPPQTSPQISISTKNQAAQTHQFASATPPTTTKISASRNTSFKWTWAQIVLGAWLAGVTALVLLMVLTSIRLVHKFSNLPLIEDTHVLGLLDECREQLGVRRKLRVAESEAIVSPALHGLFQPCLLLPHGFTANFSARELRYVFLHELAHLKRRDLWFNWLFAVLQAVHWFNPLVWLAFFRWRADRELACDAMALEAVGQEQSRDYGRTILRLLEHFTHQTAAPGMVGILEDKRQLKRRLEMIVRFKPASHWSLLALLLIGLLAIVGLTDAQNQKPDSNLPKKNVSITTTNTDSLPQSPALESRRVVTNGPAMKVTVLDDTTGQPLNHAEVLAPNEASFFGHRENAPHWFTDKNGVATIHVGETPTNSVWQSTWFTLSARKHGYAPSGVSWSDSSKDVRSDLPKEITLRLKHGTTVGGVIVDEVGRAQAGIQVRIFGSGYDYARGQERTQSYPEFWNDDVNSSLPVTDARGHWQVDDFPSDLKNVAIQFIRTDGSVERFRHLVQEINPFNDPQGAPINMTNLFAGKARFVLKYGITLRGLIADAHGHPLPNVSIQSGYGMVNLERTAKVHSDSNGRFKLHHLNHRQVILTAEDSGHPITSLVVDLHSNLPLVRLQMGKLSPLHIHVVDGQGRPIAEAKVNTVSHGTEGQLLNFSGSTDSQGDLIWSNAPNSAFALMAISPKSVLLHQSIHLKPGQREATFHLRAGMEKEIIINAWVKDSISGAPVKLESAKFETGDREGFKGFDQVAEVSGSTFHLKLAASKFRPGMYPTFQLELKAAGYATLRTPWRDFDEGDWTTTFEMQPASLLARKVLLPNGEPAARARIWARADNNGGTLFMNQPNHYSANQMVKTEADANGRFTLPEVPDDQPIVFTHPDGFLATTVAELKTNMSVRLQPWGGVTGILKIAGKPTGGVSINLQPLQWFPQVGFMVGYTTETDPDGKFLFEHVPPGGYKLFRFYPRNGRTTTEDHQQPLTVEAGKTTQVQYSNPGRAVIGQAKPDKPDLAVDWLNDDDTLTLRLPPIKKIPINPKDYATQDAFHKAWNAALQAPERLNHAREARTYLLNFNQDGSFRADDIPPGTYELKIQVSKPNPEQQFNPYGRLQNVLGSITREIVVPPGNKPFDLGTLIVPMKDDGPKSPEVNFSAQTLDGKSINLTQFKGKYVLLAFWTLWSERCTQDLASIQKLQKEMAHNDQIVFLNACINKNAEAVRKAIESRGYQWTQTSLDPADLSKVATVFDVNALPAIFLIGPNQHIIAGNFGTDRLVATVHRALKID